MKRQETTYQHSTVLFLRAMGAVYLIAFYSLSSQVAGLIGTGGVLPAANFFESLHNQFGASALWRFPSLFWLNSGDTMLAGACFAGMFLSVLLVLGIMPLLSSFLLWFLYLSLTTAGQVFLAFQWDGLLLEAGLLAVMMSPFAWRLHLKCNPRAPRIIVFLLHLLLFKLMFMSGYVKLASGDPAWRDLSALSYHLWTQPLPVWVAWYAAQLPAWLLKAAVVGMFFIELVVPFFIFLGRYFRYAAFVLFAGLQAGLVVTGNFGFFNILTLVLCLPLLDDRVFTFSSSVTMSDVRRNIAGVLAGMRWIYAAAALLVTAVLLISMARPDYRAPAPLRGVVQAVLPLRSFNSYGLFAVMTKSRPEIILEGSRDGVTWKPYEFRYKPGDVYRTPMFVAPHMPRLDWQMWFAALGQYQQNPWLLNLMVRLMEGQPDVVALLGDNPFSESPPVMMRAVLYDYRFSEPEAHREYRWWDRSLKGLYCPVLTRSP